MNEDIELQKEVKLNHQKWKKWKLYLRVNQQENRVLIGKPEDNAHNYAKRLIEKLQEENLLVHCPIPKVKAEQMENNTCTICFELMVEPYNPYILFPCGHNLCQKCLFAGKNKTEQNLRVKLCPICRGKIVNFGLNTNLMKLTSDYLNRKQKQLKNVNDQSESQTQTQIMKLAHNCRILDIEFKKLNEELVEMRKNRKIMDQVVDRLMDQRKKCRRKIDSLEDQSRKYEKYLSSKQQESEQVQQKIEKLEHSESILIETLRSLKLEKQKLQAQENDKNFKPK